MVNCYKKFKTRATTILWWWLKCSNLQGTELCRTRSMHLQFWMRIFNVWADFNVSAKTGIKTIHWSSLDYPYYPYSPMLVWWKTSTISHAYLMQPSILASVSLMHTFMSIFYTIKSWIRRGIVCVLLSSNFIITYLPQTSLILLSRLRCFC